MVRYISTAFVAVMLLGTNACLQSESVPCGTDGPVCPKGWVCIAELNACIDPIETLCGNGTQDEGEECDDGNLENHDSCNWNCRVPKCGDGFLDAPEVCDDGNTVNGDGCDAQCLSLEVCGDSIRNNYTHGDNVPPEECDEGGVNTATCNADCTEARCGDGKVNEEANEFCDGGDPITRIAVDTSECNKDCTIASCGDGYSNGAADEQCDTGRYCANGTACTAAAQCAGIGDGQCTTRDFDCCTRTCRNPVCGNGVFEPECQGFPLEVCDDGSHCEDLRPCSFQTECAGVGDGLCKPRNGTGCDQNCAFPEICGDGEVQAYAPYFEVCDDGMHCSDGLTACTSSADCGAFEDKTCMTRNGTGCSANCSSDEDCGDGILNPYPRRQLDGSFLDPEVCDDGRQCADGRQCTNSAECADSAGDQVCRVRNADGCGLNCLSVEVCGDGVLNDYRHAMVNLKPMIGVVGTGQTIFRSEECDDGSHCFDGTPCVLDSECATQAGEDKLCSPRDGDGCTADCLSKETCGDGYFNDYIHEDVLGTSFPAEICDDGNNTPDDGCSASCSSTEQCGNGIEDPGEECDEGETINGTEDSECTRNCTISACGNGRRDPGEQCDRTEASGGNLENGPCNTSCVCNVCGDNVVNTEGPFAAHCSVNTAFEECDTGGINSATCNFNCTQPECGDGIVNFLAGESCDEGPPDDPLATGSKQTTTCNSDCSIAYCGDGKLNTAREEICDDGNNTNGDGCSADCKSNEFCGDGIVNSYVHIDGLGGNLPSELCDDGMHCSTGDACTSDADCGGVLGDCVVRNGTGCSADCLSVEICGDSYLSDYAPLNETCDDGNENSLDGCDGDTCIIETGWSCPALGTPCFEICGDGLVVGEETCDDGDQDAGDGCGGTCQQELGWDCPTDAGVGGECAPVCGDFLIRGAETCDDGDQLAGDGCSDVCASESGWSCPGVNGGVGGVCAPVCGDGVVSGSEECDDSDLDSGDGCSAICRAELGWVCPSTLGQPVGGTCVSDCGDFLIRGTEQCDDGNTDNNDGCDSTCKFEEGWVCPAGFSVIGGVCTATCGDGLVRGAESCDDNDTLGGDGCDSGCKQETGWSCPVAGGQGGDCGTVCGDGLIRGTESCDESNSPASGGCNACVAADGWRCPTAGGNGGLCTTICGDGKVRGAETCDDTNLVSNDGCSAVCASEAGWTCPTAGGTGGACTTICGDTLVRGAETCDEGASPSMNGCTACVAQTGWSCPTSGGAGGTCLTVCGDRLIRGTETCDDGAKVPGDGCDDVCQAESGWNCPVSGGSGGACATVCGDGIKAGTEQCDDNGTASGDGCDSGCRGETPVVGADTFRALFGESSYAITVSTLTANDSAFARPSFDPDLVTGCGGSLVHDAIGGTLTFTPAVVPTCGTPWLDTFSYELCNPAVPALCTSAAVTIRLNRLPVLTDANTCVLAGTANASLNVASIYSDADSQPVNVSSITASVTAGGTSGVSGTLVTWTPTTPANPASFNIPLQACDSGDPAGCDTATWSVLWNDVPVLQTTLGSSPQVAVKGTNVDTLLTTLIVSPGAVPVVNLTDPAKPWIATAIGAITVSASENGTYAASANTAKGTCTVRASDIRFTVPGAATNGSDSCWVKVCEVCAGATVCSKQQLSFTVQTCSDTAPNLGQDLGCSVGAPLCDEDADGGPACVGCLLDAQCAQASPSTPVCSSDTFTCVKCFDDDDGVEDNGCADPAPACKTSNPKACVECTAAADCARRGDDYDICTSNVCNECVTDTECGAEFCVTRTINTVDRKVCVECKSDTDCSNGDVCDPATDTCVGCVDGTDCVDPSAPICNDSKICVECVDASTCDAGEQCDAGFCVGCIGSEDCTNSEAGDICSSGACGCATSANCNAVGFDVCDTDNDVCVECVSNLDCETTDFACTNNVCVPPSVVAMDDTFGYALDPDDKTWMPADFTDNDSFADDATFEIDGVSGETVCGGLVDFAGGVVTLVPPLVPGDCQPIAFQDSFDYMVCNEFDDQDCDVATVTIIYNRSPIVTDAAVCVAADTATAMVDVAGNYSDPDGNLLASGGVTITEQAVGGNAVVGNETEITFTPTTPATAAAYVLTFQMCDTETATIWDSACTEAFLTVTYNDDPMLKDLASVPTVVAFEETVEILFADILDTWGVLGETTPFASIKVSATENGTYDTTASAVGGGTCSIVNTDSVQFEAPAMAATSSCWIEVCEACGATPACTKTQIVFTTQFCVPDDGELDRGCDSGTPVCDDTVPMVSPECVVCLDDGPGEFDQGCESALAGLACDDSADPSVCVECTDDEDCGGTDTCTGNVCVTP